MSAAVAPQNLSAEESVLGAMLLSPHAIGAVRPVVAAGDFYRKSHGTLFAVAVDMHDRGIAVDVITLVDELERRQLLGEIGGRVRVHELAALVPASANAGHHARIVREMARRRVEIKTADRLREAAESGGLDAHPELRKQVAALLLSDETTKPALPFAIDIEEFITDKSDTPVALIGDETEALLPVAGLLILFAKGGKGKTTLTVDAALHLASGRDWLGFRVARPLRVLLIENEGPREPFRAKLELKRRLWEHELAGALYVHTLDWGAFSLADDPSAARLRLFVSDNAIDVVVGDPLDSLGLDGIGSPEDTRAFVDRMTAVGLFRDVAFWLLHHARKESAADELDGVSGAWGGRPDTMLMLEKQDGNRARLSFPKLRWSRRGDRPALILAFDPEEEAFAVAHVEEGLERDYIAEIEALFSDGEWRIVKEIGAPNPRGIGANIDTVRKILEGNPDRFVFRDGKDAGRRAGAIVWQRTRASESVESVKDSNGDELVTDLTDFPLRGSRKSESVPAEFANGTDSPESVESESVTEETT